MKLLIITQKVNKDDSLLGFFVRWIAEFSKNFEKVTVITLEKGQYELPSNVSVYSLGKEVGASKFKILLKFYWLILRERKNYDTVFVHMNPIYLVLAGLIWKMWNVKVSLWYTHRKVDLKLRIAHFFSSAVFTASRESFNLFGPKVMITGHGIDVASFAALSRTKPLGTEPLKIISVGRITAIKDPLTLVQSAQILFTTLKKRFKVDFIGGPNKADDYVLEKKVIDKIGSLALGGIVNMLGDVSPQKVKEHLRDVDISVNLTPTGGVDKVILEAMASGIVTVSSNEAFRNYFGKYADRLIFKHGNSVDLANKIRNIVEVGDLSEIGGYLQSIARERCEVAPLIKKISEKIKLIS